MVCSDMTARCLLDGVTIWASVVFILIGCFQQLSLSWLHMFCLTGWFFTQLVVISWTMFHSESATRISKTQTVNRPGADDGLWCCLLVPLTVLGGITSVYKEQNDILKQGSVSMSNDLLFSLVASTTVLSSTRLPYLTVSFIWLLPLSVHLDAVSIGLLVLMSLSLHCGVRRIPTVLPKSFSIGEISVLVQLISLIAWRSVCCLKLTLMERVMEQPIDVRVVSVVGLFSATMATFAALYVHHPNHPYMFFMSYGVVAFILAFPVLYFFLPTDPFTWLAVFIVTKSSRIYLLVYWLACSVVAFLVVHTTNVGSNKNEEEIMNEKYKLSTVIRKYFHVLTLFVYVPGLLVDVNFLLLGSAVALAVFILLEAIRILRVPPLGEPLHEAFSVFIDERDSGKLIFTHIYLLVGLSAPVWISYSIHTKDSLLPLFSGVLSLAVGDTAASVGGSWIGWHRWPGTRKTIEGTLFCVTSQLTMVALLVIAGVLPRPNVIYLVIAVILESCFEAFTLQIDNLVLPLLTFALLSPL